MNKQENELLKAVLDKLEEQFDPDLDAFAEVVGYDDDIIDIQVTMDYAYEILKLSRSLLNSGKSPTEIAMEIA